MDGDGIVYAQAFGLRNREEKIPVDIETQFNIGSCSKIFTAAAILMLTEDGKLELDKPVTNYLPTFKMADPRYKNITVRMLINHSSGMPGTNYKDSQGSIKNRQYIEETLTLLADCRLKSNPGEISAYCNDGFTVAEAVIEKVSGMSYSDFMEKRIFEKAGMNNTSCYFKDGNKNITRYYESDTGVRSAPTEYVSALGAGGISSTPIDLCRFAHAMWRGKLLNAKSLAEYIKPQYGPYTAISGKPYFKYGLCWDSVLCDEFACQDITVLAKNGGTTQFHTQIYTAPKEKLSVALVVCGNADVTEITSKIMQALLEEKGYIKPNAEKSYQSLANAAISDEMLRFEGVYMSKTGALKIVFDKTKNTVKFFKFKNGEFIDTKKQDEFYLKNDGLFHINDILKFGFAENNKGKYLVVYLHGSPDSVVDKQMLPPLATIFSTTKFDNKLWLLRNLSYSDLDASSAIAKSLHVKGMPGYVCINNDIFKLTGEGTATSALPYCEETKEASVFEKNGETYLKILGYLYSESKNLALLQPGETVIIGKDGYSEWRAVNKDFTLDCSVPEKSRILVLSFSEDILYDSLIEGLKPFDVKKGTLVDFIGQPGGKFVLP